MGVIAALLLAPIDEASAHRLGCNWLARDSSAPFAFNYAWVTAIVCTDETDALKVSPHLQYYDWGNSQWRDLSDLTHVSESNDDMVASYGALYVPPYLGINCRCIRSYIVTVDQHDEDVAIFDETVYSLGECY